MKQKKRKRPGKPAGMNYAGVLKERRDRLQLAMDEDVSRMDIRYYGKLKID